MVVNSGLIFLTIEHMYCTKCGGKNDGDAKYCMQCGAAITMPEIETKDADASKIAFEPKGVLVNETNNQTIKCGNCDYVGAGERARSTWAQVLAWFCVWFAPLITILYFVATPKYRCPKCNSTFLGVKNREGTFTKGQSGASKALTVFIIVLGGIAVMGILSSVVLASLNTARSKGNDAAIKANLASLMAQAEVYYGYFSQNGYGVSTNNCSSGMFLGDKTIASSIAAVRSANGQVTCNSTTRPYPAYAVQSTLSTQQGDSKDYFCVDSMGHSAISTIPLGMDTVCP